MQVELIHSTVEIDWWSIFGIFLIAWNVFGTVNFDRRKFDRASKSQRLLLTALGGPTVFLMLAFEGLFMFIKEKYAALYEYLGRRDSDKLTIDRGAKKE